MYDDDYPHDDYPPIDIESVKVSIFAILVGTFACGFLIGTALGWILAGLV